MVWFKKIISKSELVSDKTLVKKAKDGSGDAFGKLYLRYLDPLYRYIFFRVNQNKQEAEDLTEVVFIKAWEKISFYKSKNGSFRSWLYRIAHNTVIDYYRTQKTYVELNENIDIPAPAEDESLLTDHELSQALKNLTNEQKEIITLKYIEGLNNKEIENITSKSQEAIRAIQYRGLKKLKENLK